MFKHSIEKPSDSFFFLLILILSIITFFPFIDKPFNMDDPLFIWSAEHIKQNPFDFYGFNVNWYFFPESMSVINKNPPLTSYFIALIGTLFGNSEKIYHLAFFFPAFFSAIGIYFLAKEFTNTPIIAVMIFLGSPMFIISGTSIMCDVIMLCFWIFSIFFWMKALNNKKSVYFIFASFMMSLAGLSKYFGISLIPLIFIYTILREKKIGAWVLYLMIPISLMLSYNWITIHLYGHGLLFDVVGYSLRSPESSNYLIRLIEGLIFIGGATFSILFFMCWKKKRYTIYGILVFFLLLVLYLKASLYDWFLFGMKDRSWTWNDLLHIIILGICGSYTFIMAFNDFIKTKSPESVLLLIWLLGTFIFSSFLNWTTNGRSILPLVPVIGILLAREMERKKFLYEQKFLRITMLALFFGWILSLGMARVDYQYAHSAKSASVQIGEKFANPQRQIIFQGHWGFQYYMEKAGGLAFNFHNQHLNTKDILVVPRNNTNIILNQQILDKLIYVETIQRTPAKWFTLFQDEAGAGFYSTTWGTLPFKFGEIPFEGYDIFEVKAPLSVRK